MYQRSISEEEVRIVIKTGETIEDYPADFPYPSRLVLGWHGPRPVHVVVADNTDDRENIVIQSMSPILQSGKQISKGESRHEMRRLQEG
jgi:hypothetical protein